MPVDMSKYPPEWPQIRERILVRAGNVCERCGVANGVYRAADARGDRTYRYAECVRGVCLGWNYQTEEGEWMDDPSELDGKPARIVLTIAHVNDPDPQNCADDNLQALCQRCHNRLDAPMRAKNAARTRGRNRRAADVQSGQNELPL